MNVAEIAGMIAELDAEIIDAEIAGAGLEDMVAFREERAALVREGVALEEREAEEAAALDLVTPFRYREFARVTCLVIVG